MGTKSNTNYSFQSEKDNANNKTNNNTTNVVLNVYDLTPLNNYFYWFGFGIFHSGIQGSFPITITLFVFLFLLHSMMLIFFIMFILINSSFDEYNVNCWFHLHMSMVLIFLHMLCD
jgi:hypothetical protein